MGRSSSEVNSLRLQQCAAELIFLMRSSFSCLFCANCVLCVKWDELRDGSVQEHFHHFSLRHPSLDFAPSVFAAGGVPLLRTLLSPYPHPPASGHSCAVEVPRVSDWLLDWKASVSAFQALVATA